MLPVYESFRSFQPHKNKDTDTQRNANKLTHRLTLISSEHKKGLVVTYLTNGRNRQAHTGPQTEVVSATKLCYLLFLFMAFIDLYHTSVWQLC
jgi:hypothetical protein